MEMKQKYRESCVKITHIGKTDYNAFIYLLNKTVALFYASIRFFYTWECEVIDLCFAFSIGEYLSSSLSSGSGKISISRTSLIFLSVFKQASSALSSITWRLSFGQEGN